MAGSWEKIDGFQSLGEFVRFASWINEQADSGMAIKVPVSSPYLGISGFDEDWFRHSDNGQLWRLVKPDFPFTGLFEPVDGLSDVVADGDR